MTVDGQVERGTKTAWLPIMVLLILLYLMYSPTFLSDYLMNDEWARIGVKTQDVITAMTSNFLLYGRGLFGLYQKLVYDFVGYETGRIQFIRFINFASFAAIAVVLFKFLESRMKSSYLALFTVLFFLSQPAIQGLMGYSLQLIANSLPAIWLSLAAFFLFFFVFERSRIPTVLQAVIVFIILTLAMQSTQAYAFFAVIPLSYLALSEWGTRKARILQFFSVMVVVLAFSLLLYKIGLDVLHSSGEEAYRLGEQGLSSLLGNPGSVVATALNPLSYWSVFKMWTFPYPFQNVPVLSSRVKEAGSIFLMVVWLGIVLSSIWVELRGSTVQARREVLLKWLVVFALLGLAAVFIVADSPLKIIDHRPHVLLTFSGLVIFSGAYALQVLAPKVRLLRGNGVKIVAGVLFLLVAFGAQAGVSRNIVENQAGQLAFVRSELLVKDPASYDTVIVVLPKWQGCITEPCGPWFGAATQDPEHLSHRAAYHYVLATLGADRPFKSIRFADEPPSEIPQDAVLVDWNQYSLAQQRYARNFLSDR